MESEILEKFKTELSAVSEKKILSKAKIQSITKAALKAKSNYKHVVYNIERLMAKSNPPQRLSTLYIIDSIIRASKHQLKEKDVFGPRFIKLFDRILDHMLRCGHKEQLKTIRMLNLWMSNRVYPEAEIQPFREKFKNAGVVISFEEVEKAVKGADADMSIYSGTYKKKAGSKSKSDKRHQSSSATAPSLARHDMPTFSLSEEILDGTISEREMMELAQQAKIDGASLLGNNRELLQKVLQVFSSCLKQSISEGDNGNKIQNVLTKDFEYSDDEEDKEKEPEDVEPKKLTHNEVLSMAQNLLETPTIRIKLAEVFGAKTSNTLPANEASLKVAEAPIALQPQQNILPLQPLPGFPGQQMVQPNLAGLNATQMLNVQNAQKLMLQQRAAQLQALQNLPPNQRNLILLGNPLVHPFGLPPGVNHPLLPTPDLQSVAQHQQQLVLNSINNPAEGNANAEGISQDASRPRPKESRERRKLGFPPGKPGFTLIATRTLWLKKIPTNVTENELKLAVESCGEASRVKIIGNRACAFITMDTRRAANEVIQKLREVSVAKKMVKVYWARGPGMDADEYKDLWDSDVGVLEIPYEKLPLDLSPLCEGAVLDLDSLPESRRMMYKETGERVVAVPKPMGLLPPPTTQPPPVNFPFPVNMGQFAGAPGFNNGKPNPAGVQPLLNLTVPPPPGVQPFTTAPPPPGVGPPPSAAFNPHKPPPMGRFNSNLPPLTQFPGGSGGVPMNHPFLGPPQPMPFRGGADRGGYDMMRAGPPPRSDFQRDRERGRLPDQAELWKKRERERERERSQGNRWGRDEHDGGSRRRVSRWGDDDRRYDGPDAQRRSPRRTRRPSSNESRHVAKADLARSNADDETVSSTTLDELKPSKEAPPIEEPAKHDDHREDKTEEVPMDLE